MKVETSISLRYLRSKKRFSFLSAIAVISAAGVVLGVATLTVVLSVINGFEKEYKKSIIGATAHGVILKYGVDFAEHEQITKLALQTPGIKAASPFVLGEIMASSGKKNAGVLIKGIVADPKNKVSELKDNLIDGRFEWLNDPSGLIKNIADDNSGSKEKPPDAVDEMDAMEEMEDGEEEAHKQPEPGVILGKELAQTLEVKVGDKMYIINPLGDSATGAVIPTPKSWVCRVAGIFSVGYYEYDSKLIYMSLKDAQDFMSMNGFVSGIEVKVNEIEKAPEIMTAVYEKIGGYPYRTRNWRQMNYNLFSALGLYKMVMFIILVFIILVAAFNIISTLYLFVTEKEKEIAILKSMGASNRMISGIFTRIGLMVGAGGTICGVGLGFLICFAITLLGYHLDPDIYLIDKLPVEMQLTDFGVVAAASIGICFLATIIPAYIASHTRPADGLRYD